MIAQYIREKGVIQGHTQALVNLLEARFGGIPDWATQKIEQADLAVIEAWTIRVSTAQTIADVFEG